VIEDFSLAQNRLHVRGAQGWSIKGNVGSMAAIGLREGIDVQKTITDQGTLDALAQTEADVNSALDYSGQIQVVDTHPTGTYHLDDNITVTSPTLGLSGLYQVKLIERDATNPNYARLELGARRPESWQTLENFKRMASDLMVVV
jgi:hypothetical protein